MSSAATLMALDEELTESMRRQTHNNHVMARRRGRDNRNLSMVGDSVADFEAFAHRRNLDDGEGDEMMGMADDVCADFPVLDAEYPAGAETAAAGEEQNPEARTNNVDLGLLFVSTLQNMNRRGARNATTDLLAPFRPPRDARVRVNPSMQHHMMSKQGLDRNGVTQADLSAESFARGRTLSPSAFLEPGMTFRGTQDVSPSFTQMMDEAEDPAAAAEPSRESWDLRITVEEANFARGYVCGTMHANGFNCGAPNPNSPPHYQQMSQQQSSEAVATFWEGEIIDNVNHTFYTQKWGATKAIDRKHWVKLAPFARALSEAKTLSTSKSADLQSEPIDLTSQPFVYLRLKEKYFLNEEPGGNLTIAGFYYLCISRATGEITGYYFDPNSTPYQKVSLQVSYQGSSGFISAGGDLV